MRDRIARASAPGGEVESLLAGLADRKLFSGTVLVAIDGTPVLVRAHGRSTWPDGPANTPETRYNIGSMNKMFTALAIAQLVEQGRLAYADKLTKHLPDFPADPGDRITLHHLLTHTSGLGLYWGAPAYLSSRDRISSVADYMAVIEPKVAFEPGQQFFYSNSGYIVLGAVIERVTGKDYYDVIRDRVLAPAGMSRTDYPTLAQLGVGDARGHSDGCQGRPDCAAGPLRAVSGEPNRGGPAGGGSSTAGDLLKFHLALQENRLVSAASLRELTTPKVTPPPPGPPPYGYGFGSEIRGGVRIVGHTGGADGFGALLDMYVDVPATVVILTNQSGALVAAARGLRRLFTPPVS